MFKSGVVFRVTLIFSLFLQLSLKVLHDGDPVSFKIANIQEGMAVIIISTGYGKH